jgi:hypothetical protein
MDRMKRKKIANALKNKRGASQRTKQTLLHHICFLPTVQ